ncbi:MAG: phosphoglycerate mutase family protein [Leeuwenhoekiella sp.]
MDLPDDTTYYFIRHAEKERGSNAGNDPLLTEKGNERATFWARYFKDKNLDAVYSTDTKRTLATAQPTANLYNVEIKSYDAGELYSDDFKKETMGKRVLVVGHSNTTPEFVNAILETEKYPHINDSEFGTVYKVTWKAGEATVEKETINNWDNP